MSKSSDRAAREQQLSVLNWMGTLLISLIPGLNIVMFIAWQFMPVKKVRKRFALAALLLTIILLLATFICFMVWGDQIVAWLKTLQVQPAPVE